MSDEAGQTPTDEENERHIAARKLMGLEPGMQVTIKVNETAVSMDPTSGMTAKQLYNLLLCGIGALESYVERVSKDPSNRLH